MGQRIDAPFWVREPGEFVREGDQVVCRWHGVEWAMSRAIAKTVRRRLDKVLDEWDRKSAEVVRLPQHGSSGLAADQ